MNPSKMRNTYGKLMYILMDTESYNIKSDLRITFVKPILTVHSFLKARDALHILKDPLFSAATVTISSDAATDQQRAVAAAAKKKAEEDLLRKYISGRQLITAVRITPPILSLRTCFSSRD